jgi:MinD superfamily P-loop ATPase
MREVVIISGKGGTGKTSLSAAFAALNAADCVACDCDVDAANMHLVLGADFGNAKEFQSGHEAQIDPMLCRVCGKCMSVCRFGAIAIKEGRYAVDSLACEGCHYCATICKPGAIAMVPRIAGESYVSTTRFGNGLVHAKLGIGAENSGKLVAHTKERARKAAKEAGAEFILVDGSPGIGCPVVSSLSGASLVVLVSEASVSGLHDLARVVTLCQSFGQKTVALINKYDLSETATADIEEFLKKEEIPLVGKLPYTKAVWESLGEGKTLYEHPELRGTIRTLWERIATYM